MFKLSDLAPKESPRMMDLVKAAGVDVSDWAKFKGGRKKAASNPKYCYEWAFVQPKRVVVLNLWYPQLEENNGVIRRTFNMREVAQKVGRFPGSNVRRSRAQKMDKAIQRALQEKLPIRVIVCDGKIRGRDDVDSSRAIWRLLDDLPWTLTAYDSDTGQCTLTRGPSSKGFVDQFSIGEESPQQAERRTISTEVFQRSSEVRRRVLLRANGRCEWCSQAGFKMPDGRIYLETHHVIPLADDGLDVQTNVAALCPNHHREAHHGEIRDRMRQQLLDRLAKL